MEIDGVQLDNLVTEYTFDSTGVHTVKYELYDETKLGNNAPAFYNITSLISVSIPNSVTTIGMNVFNTCTSIRYITIPNSVTSIGQSAFYFCTGLKRLTIPSGVTSIGDGAFGGCGGLATITVDSNNSTYDSRNNCNAIINTNTNTLVAGCKNTVIPNTVTSIGGSAFQEHTSLTGTLTIPNSVTSIGSQSFSSCSGLTSVTIPSGVTSIDNFAFGGCSGLTSATIGSGVTSIGNSAFIRCSSLTSVTIEATTPPTLGGSAFSENASGRKIYVPSANVETYKAASGWSSYASAIQAIPSA